MLRLSARWAVAGAAAPRESACSLVTAQRAVRHRAQFPRCSPSIAASQAAAPVHRLSPASGISMAGAWRRIQLCRCALRGHGVCCAGSKHQTFQQGIARQPIASMDPRAGSFACGVESRQRSPRIQVGAHSAHGVVCCGTNRNQFARDVQPILSAGFVDASGSAASASRRPDGSHPDRPPARPRCSSPARDESPWPPRLWEPVRPFRGSAA